MGPRKLRYAAALFICSAVAVLLTGCSAAGGADETGSACQGLRGLALAMRPSGQVASDPAKPQRHAREPQFSTVHLAPISHRQAGAGL